MTIHEVQLLSDEELKELAKMKGKDGNATQDARYAQTELWVRTGGGFNKKLCRYPYGSKRFNSANGMSGWK